MAQSSEIKLLKRFDQNVEITGTLTVDGTTADFANYLTSIPSEYLTQTEGDNRYLQSFDITTQTDSKYLRSNANDTATGTIDFNGTVNLNSTVRLNPNGTNFEIDTDTTDRVLFSFNKDGTRNWSLRAEGANLNFYRDSGTGTVKFTKISPDRIEVGSSVNSDYLTGDSKMSVNGYIMVKGIVNASETGTGPAAIVFGDAATFSNDKISLVTTGLKRLFVNSNGNVTIYEDLQVNGDVSGANLNISNWDTAYSWGDHSTAGYIVGESDTLATVNSRGNTTGDALVVTAVDAAGNVQPSSNNIRVSGYGIIGNRGTFYVTNGGGNVQIGNGTIHNQNPSANFSASSISLYRPTSVTGTLSSTSSITAGGSIAASATGFVELKADQTDSAAVRMGVSSGSTEGFIMCDNTGANHLSGNASLKMLVYSTGGALVEAGRFTTDGLGIGTDTLSAVDTNNGTPKLQVQANASAGNHPLAARFTVSSDAGDNSGVSVLINSGNDRGLMISAGRAVGNVARSTLNIVDNVGNELTDGITLIQHNSGGTTSRMGLGTTSPNAKLHIDNPSGDADLILEGSSQTMRIDQNSIRTTTNSVIGIFVNNDSSKGLRILTNGNVGFGTTSPTQRLHVVGKGLFTDDIQLTQTNPRIDYDNGNSGALRFFSTSTNSERMRITSSGEVGINTTSPGHKLHVVGNTMLDGNVYIDTNTGSSALYVTRSGATNQALKIWTDDSTCYLEAIQDENTGAYGSVQIALDSGGVNNSFNVTDGVNGTSRFFVSNNGNGGYFNSGNFGINNTSPSYTLDVAGSARVGGNYTGTEFRIEATDTAGAPAATATIRMKGYEGRAIGTFFEDVSYSGREWFAGLRYSGSFANYQIGYDASGGQSEYAAKSMMTITNGGRVGIGTSAPTGQLHVEGYTYLNPSTSAALVVGRVSGTPSIVAGSDDGGYLLMDSNGGMVGLNWYNNQTVVLANGGGNVGVGRSDPGYRLDVSGDIRATATIRAATDIYVGDQIIHDGDTNTYLQFHNNDQFRVVIAGGEVTEWGANYMKMSDNDVIRLGSGSDFRMWHDGTSTIFRNYNHAGGNIYWQGEDAEGTNHGLLYMINDVSRPYLRLFENGSERLRTTSAGVTVYGSLTATGDVIAYSTSDKRLKDNIKPIDSAIDKVQKISGVTFDWNDKQDLYKGHDIGVIAQEVEEVLPEVVSERENGYKAVKYEKIVPLLIEAIKEQQKQIDELKSLINKS